MKQSSRPGTRTGGFCRASVSHVARFPLSEAGFQTGGGEGREWAREPRTTGDCLTAALRKSQECPRHGDSGGPGSVCRLPRPSPSAGERSQQNERSVRVLGCLPARGYLPHRQVHAQLCLTVFNLKTGKGMEVEADNEGVLASCCLSTQPVSTSQEPERLHGHLTTKR